MYWLVALVLLGGMVACTHMPQQPSDAQPSPKLAQDIKLTAPQAGTESQVEAPPVVPSVVPETLPSGSVSPAEPFEAGYASWYGARFHKRRTASGELFDMHAYTAAHPSLPFGTLVCVHSPQTGKTLQVRINDRGPHTRKRIIDVSRAAAKALGILAHGVKHVELMHPLPGAESCPER
jgi:rare lipoprotein A